MERERERIVNIHNIQPTSFDSMNVDDFNDDDNNNNIGLDLKCNGWREI